MCGIFFSLSTRITQPNQETRSLLEKRGPDSTQTHTVCREVKTQNAVSQLQQHLTFISTVLSLRGDHVYSQPLIDSLTQSVLCWNGEAWKIGGEPVSGNDTERVFNLFLQAVKSDCNDASQRLAEAAATISGPFAFVFYDAVNARLFFSRDCLGRRSLLQGFEEDGSLRICSICDGSSSTLFDEVGFAGIYMINLDAYQDTSASPKDQYKIETLPWSSDPTPPAGHIGAVPKSQFSSQGGLDCTLLARLSHDILPSNEPIDLLNVAFENPRVTAAANSNSKQQNPSSTSPSPSPISAYEACPDRITGRSAFAELQQACPGRTWRFVAIDIPYTETLSHRDQVKRLMRPHNTEMDLSIACALYFASRGQGRIHIPNTDPEPYATSARVLLSGLGADELFAGYGRHGIAFNRNGFEGLISEINLDVSRLGQRNLGRDDRVLSHWGRETRFPFLDEDFVAWVLRAPVWEKCGFGLAELPDSDPEAQTIATLDKEKMALRLVALRLSLPSVAREKKRAIQFGARTAKMEKGHTKGTDILI
ncbi:hypothetical protein N7448_001268 [Penicillium atrosanguineum]|nr:hypothetical protein N7448_001268 [Penicillium atrosanguineum]